MGSGSLHTGPMTALSRLLRRLGVAVGLLSIACNNATDMRGLREPVHQAPPSAAESSVAAGSLKTAPGRRAAAPGARPSHEGPIEYVLLVSVDGLAPRFVDELTRAGDLPTFRHLQQMGAWTHNARTDVTFTVTLPNHTSMLTGRPVTAVEGLPATTHHGITYNALPAVTDTVHNIGNPSLSYVASVMDVVHDHGGRTCFFASKDKFILFEQSYDAHAGAPDRVGEDNGRDKIDVLKVTNQETSNLIDTVTRVITNHPCTFTFLHISDTDSPAGHGQGWGSPQWLDVLRQVDDWLGRVLGAMEANGVVRHHWALILTADHGGKGYNHQNSLDPLNYVIPFYVMGPDVPRGVDLYSVVADTRYDPGTTQPPYTDPHPPIRNGDAGNLALELLGLPYIPGSLMRGMKLLR